MNSTQQSQMSANRRFKRTMTLSIVAVILAVAVGFLATSDRDRLQSERLRQRLIGAWTDEIVRSDRSVEVWIWEFRPDGTIRNYPMGKPFRETGRVDDYIQWDVSGGQLVLSWDHHFPREASLKQRLRQASRLVTDRLSDNKIPLAYSDRCVIHDDGGDTISFTLHPNETEAEAYVPRQFTLTREKGP